MKRINKIILPILLVCLMSFNGISQEIKSIKIIYTHPDILSPIRISCTDFDYWAEDSCDTIIIEDKERISQISKIISSFKRDYPSRKYDSVNVRIKLYITFVDEYVSEVCLSRFTVMTETGGYDAEPLFGYIVKMFTEKQKQDSIAKKQKALQRKKAKRKKSR